MAPARSSSDPATIASSLSQLEPQLSLNGFKEGGEGERPPRSVTVMREHEGVAGMGFAASHSQPPNPSGDSACVYRGSLSAPLEWSGKGGEGNEGEEVKGVSEMQLKPFRKRVGVCQLSMDHNTEMEEVCDLHSVACPLWNGVWTVALRFLIDKG